MTLTLPTGLLALDPRPQLGAPAGGDRPRRAALVERDATRGGQLEQLLALLPLARAAQEQPAEQTQA